MNKPRYALTQDGEGWTHIIQTVKGKKTADIALMVGACNSYDEVMKLLENAYRSGYKNAKRNMAHKCLRD